MTDTSATKTTSATVTLTPSECDLITRALRHLANGIESVKPETGDLYDDNGRPADTMRALSARIFAAGFPDPADDHMQLILRSHPGITSVAQFLQAATNGLIDCTAHELDYATKFAARTYGTPSLATLHANHITTN